MEEKQWQLREAQKFQRTESRWTIGTPLSRADPYLPAGGDTTNKHTGFPDRITHTHTNNSETRGSKYF